MAQRPELAAGDRVRQGEGVAPEHVDVLEAERGQAGHVLIADLVALGTVRPPRPLRPVALTALPVADAPQSLGPGDRSRSVEAEPPAAESNFRFRCYRRPIIVVLAATLLGNIVPPAFRLRPDLLASLVVAAGVGLTAGLALLEQGPRRSLQLA